MGSQLSTAVVDTSETSEARSQPLHTGRLLNRRVAISERGGPDVLRIIGERMPEPAAGEVRVKIQATGVSFADLLMREGVHPETPQGTITLGWDLVGVVDKLGPNVTGLNEGDSVAALPMLGACADFICLRAAQLVPVPAGLDPAKAVAMVLNYMTAYQMMHRTAKVKPGQTVLIHGAAGGIGTAQLQLGGLIGLIMYGTASQSSLDIVKDLGAIPIDYKASDFVQEIASRTAHPRCRHRPGSRSRGRNVSSGHWLNRSYSDQTRRHSQGGRGRRLWPDLVTARWAVGRWTTPSLQGFVEARFVWIGSRRTAGKPQDHSLQHPAAYVATS